MNGRNAYTVAGELEALLYRLGEGLLYRPRHESAEMISDAAGMVRELRQALTRRTTLHDSQIVSLTLTRGDVSTILEALECSDSYDGGSDHARLVALLARFSALRDDMRSHNS